MRAWLFALSTEPGAQDRLAEALVQGADPWVKTAVFRGWGKSTSFTLHEAVLAARETLGKAETVSRLSHLARYSRPAESGYEQRVLARLARIGVTERFPVALLDRWIGLNPRPQTWRGLLPLLTERTLSDNAWGLEAIQWAHKAILRLPAWPAPLLDLLERIEDPALRDGYWQLSREPETKPKPIAPR